MSLLTYRAEQVVLGTLLRGVGPPPGDLPLHQDDFTRAHAVVFRVLLEQPVRSPAMTGLIDPRVEDLLLVELGGAGADRAWLLALADHAVDERRLEAYVRMVQAGALRRDLSLAVDRLSHRAADTDFTRALRSNTAAFAQLTADLDDPGARRDAGTGVERLGSASPPRAEAMVDGAAPPGDPRAVREEMLLADLLRHPEQGVPLVRTLSDEAFTHPVRRAVYRMMVTLAFDREPVDQTLLVWHLETEHRLQVQMSTWPEGATVAGPASGPVYAAYVNRLTRTTPTATAIDLARELIATDIRAAFRFEAEPYPGPEARTTRVATPNTEATAPQPPLHQPPPHLRPEPGTTRAPGPRP